MLYFLSFQKSHRERWDNTYIYHFCLFHLLDAWHIRWKLLSLLVCSLFLQQSSTLYMLLKTWRRDHGHECLFWDIRDEYRHHLFIRLRHIFETSRLHTTTLFIHATLIYMFERAKTCCYKIYIKRYHVYFLAILFHLLPIIHAFSHIAEAYHKKCI